MAEPGHNPTAGAQHADRPATPRAPARPTSRQPGLLFTCFEPSADDHASAVIAELKSRHPGLPIHAWGGPKMAAAGAEIVERTGHDAVVGVPGLVKILEHRRINRAVADWLTDNPVQAHIPVDSPAANFPICEITRRRGLKIIHLVAPQLWAWGAWRIKKMRRLSDRVLCLLPFEDEWFLSRGVKAEFIGHPLFDHPLDTDALDQRAADLPTGEPKIALMPGSRPGEIAACFPVLLDAMRRLRADFPGAVGVVAATREEVADRLRALADQHSGWPEGLDMIAGDTDAVIRWCDYALVVSGTVTLQIARQHKPMAAFYRPNRLLYHLIGRWIVSTRTYTLPNLIAGRRIIEELIPHFGTGEELAVSIIRLMRQPGLADDQRAALEAVCEKFKDLTAAQLAANAIEKELGLKPAAA